MTRWADLMNTRDDHFGDDRSGDDRTGDDLSDDDLARAARAGSVAAFGTLARRHQVALVRFLRRRCGSGDADDIAQDTFLKAFQSIATYRDGGSFKSWLFTIGYRSMISAARRKAVDRSVVSPTLIADARDDPSHLAATREKSDRIWDVARRLLSDSQYTALWLYYVESMPTRQIAGVTGRSSLWVKTALFRARRLLRPALDDRADLAVAAGGRA